MERTGQETGIAEEDTELAKLEGHAGGSDEAGYASAIVKKFLGLVESGQLDSEVANGGKILLLTYTGGSAGEPLVVALYERFKVRANIVFGNIDFIQGAALGKLGVVLTGEKESVIQAEEYLKQNGVYVEELKNGLH